MFSRSYWPFSRVAAPYTVPEGKWVATTDAPGSGWPLLSSTKPFMAEVVTPWAHRLLLLVKSTKPSNNNSRILFLIILAFLFIRSVPPEFHSKARLTNYEVSLRNNLVMFWEYGYWPYTKRVGTFLRNYKS